MALMIATYKQLMSNKIHGFISEVFMYLMTSLQFPELRQEVRFENLRFTLFCTKKVYFKANIDIFHIFMLIIPVFLMQGSETVFVIEKTCPQNKNDGSDIFGSKVEAAMPFFE